MQVGGQLREHDQVPEARLGGQVGKVPLLLLGPLGGGRDQIGPFGALQGRGNGRRVVEVGHRYRDVGGQLGAVGR